MLIELVRFPNSLALVSTDRPRIIQRINSWVQDCDSKQCCREHFAAHPRRLPTRLLKISETALQLVAARGALPPSVVYTTLSHCWGGQPKVQLFSHTRAILERGIPLSSLPQTFRDACRVTALLGIPYIWIDSMCIIQNDAADWAREAPTMASVYGYSFLCICALDSPNSDSGLFSNRELATGVACYAYATNRRYGEEDALIVLRRYDPFLRADRGVANTRAWIFQERLLAPRTVFFGSDDVYWECACFALSDLNPSGSVTYRDKSPVSIIRRRLKETFANGTPTNNLFKQRLWHTIVKEYTSNNVTVATDRLIAFSGVAQHLCNLVQDSAYLAGFLGNFLVESLCWIPLVSQLTDTGSPFTGADNGVAPSWSWAKLNCPILGSYHFISPFGRKMLASASYDAMDFPDPFSHRVFGKVLVKGLAIPPGSLGWTEYSSTELADGSLLSQCSIFHHDWTMGMPFISDHHGYRETLSDGGLALPHLILESGGERHLYGIALFLDEPEAGSVRKSLEKSWLLQVSRNYTYYTRNQSHVWRIGLILDPVMEAQTSAMNSLGGNNVLSCCRIGVWLFHEPLVDDLEDPAVEWIGDSHQNPTDAMTPILAKWLKGLAQIEAEIY